MTFYFWCRISDDLQMLSVCLIQIPIQLAKMTKKRELAQYENITMSFKLSLLLCVAYWQELMFIVCEHIAFIDFASKYRKKSNENTRWSYTKCSIPYKSFLWSNWHPQNTSRTTPRCCLLKVNWQKTVKIRGVNSSLTQKMLSYVHNNKLTFWHF